MVDPDGVRFADALAEQLDRRGAGCRVVAGRQPHAYVEAHIEQGPSLEDEGIDIGIVTGIQGSRWFLVKLTGETAHAGTTPSRAAARRGAGHGAGDHRAERADGRPDRRAALHRRRGSRWSRTPRIRSPNRASFTIDFRHPDKPWCWPRGDAIAAMVQAAVENAAWR